MAEGEGNNKLCLTYTMMIGMLIFGTANIIIQDLQNQTCALGNFFTHPYM